MLAFTQLVCPTLRCAWAPSCRITSAKHRRPGEDAVYDNMVGQDHAVEPAAATTATVPWLLTYLLRAGCTKIGHSGCPVHHRRCQNRALHVLRALVKLAGLGGATDTMPLRTSWGEGCLSVDGIFQADAGWWAKMHDIQQKGCPLLTDPGSRHWLWEALPMAVTTPTMGHPTSRAPLPPPARAGLHQAKVLGDANAQEFGVLRDLVDATILVKPGASWQNGGKDIEACVFKEQPGTLKHNFYMVLTVLGSSDVPKTLARNQSWEAGLQECSMVGQLTSHVFVSAPFNSDPLLSTTCFIRTLREVAEEAGASFIPIEWLTVPGDTEAPHEQLQCPKPVSGLSCTPPLPLPPPRVMPYERSPAQVGSGSSSSQRENSSSSSNSSCSKQSRGHRGGPSAGKSRTPGGHEAQTGLAITDLGMRQAPALATPRNVCDICNTQGRQKSANCPLVWACSMGQSSVIGLVKQAMSKLGKIMPSPWDRSAVVAKTDVSQVIPMRSDGSCLFAGSSNLGPRPADASGILPRVARRGCCDNDRAGRHRCERTDWPLVAGYPLRLVGVE